MPSIYVKVRQECFSTEGLKRCKGKTNRRVFQRAAKRKIRNEMNKLDYKEAKEEGYVAL